MEGVASNLGDVPANIEFAKQEEQTLAYWQKIQAFETSLKMSEGKKEYTFYDGPPFATGLPHYGCAALRVFEKTFLCRALLPRQKK